MRSLVGLTNPQPLHHFLAESPWDIEAVRAVRLQLLLSALKEQEFILCIDETGDRKKGKTTDYVARQYIGNLGKTENGIVSVNAYGVLKNITFPLSFKLFKPKSRLKEKDVYRTKPQLAVEIINELKEIGFKFKVVLADSLYGVQFGEEKMGQAPYTTDNLWPQKITQKEPAPFSKPCLGESGDFIEALNRHKLNFVVAIRSNHGVWMPQGARVRYTSWKKFDRIFTNGDTEVRYIREIVFGKRQDIRYWQITTDKDELPDNSTWFIMTNLLGDITKSVGNTYGLRTWIEYGFKQVKDELGWADYRLTDYGSI